MVATTDAPINRNFLGNVGYRFWIRRLPTTNFFCQKVNVPGLSLPPAMSPNPFVDIPEPGDHIDYEQLRITFKVDEDLKNWLEIHDWIRGTGYPSEHAEYAAQAAQPDWTGLGVRVDALVVVEDLKRNVNFQVALQGAIPTSLSEINLEADAPDIQYITATATFRYIMYDITNIKFT